MKRVTPILVGLIVALVLLFLVRPGAGADVVVPGQENTAGMYRISRANLALQSTAGVPTVDGLYSGDEANYYVLGSADGGRGTLYYNLVGDTLYLLMRVDPSVNDNVFGDKDDPDDVAYLADAGWTSPKHRFKDLVKSDHVEFVLSCGSNSWNWKQDYADYDSDTDTWFSDYTGDDGDDTPPPGLIASASSLVWNLNNSPWDITLGGTRTSDKTYKSPFHSSTPDELPASYPGFDTDFQWEWAVIYETSIDISVCGGDDILVGVPSAHNSPAKDDKEDVPISPTVILSSSPEPTQTPTPSTPPSNPPRIVTDKEAVALPECQKAEVRLFVSGAGDPLVTRRPLDVMIVLDRSGSMDNAGGSPPQPITDAKEAAKFLIDQLDSSIDRVGLVSYATTATLDHGLTSNFNAVKTAIDGLTASGYTNIGGAVYEAQAELDANGRSDAVHVIILLSDGVANRSKDGGECDTWPEDPTPCTEDAINQAAAAKAKGTVIYTIGLNLDGIGDSEDLARDVLQTMASSPANYFESPDSSDLQGIFDSIADIITNIAGENVVVTDILPPDVHYVPGSAVPAPTSVSGQTLTWDLGIVGITQTHTITFQVYLDPAYSDQLVDVYPDSRVDYIDYAGNSASVPFPETRVTTQLCSTPTPTPTPTPSATPDVEISKEVDAPGSIVLVGERVTFTVQITNTGGTTIDWLPLRDEFGACLSYAAKSAIPQENNRGPGFIEWLDLTSTFEKNLAPGEVFTLTIPFTAIAAEDSATNVARVHDGFDVYGQAVPTREASATITCRLPASIGDYVWNDANGNGQQDESYGISGVTVNLYLDDGDNLPELGGDDVLVDSQVTDSNGAYDFTMLHAGTYWVDVDESTLPTGYTFIPGSQSGPKPHLVTVDYGDDYNDADFGYAGRGTVSGTVFYDWNENEQQDAGEEGIGGVEVCLYRDNGDGSYDAATDALQGCMNTNPDGTYAFTDRLPGKYFVVETQPPDLEDTTPNIREVDLVVVGTSDADTDNNFGEIVKGRIGDRTWIDSNGNGIQEAGETSNVPNVPLQVTGVNILGDVINLNVTTSITGYYIVDNLLPGTYTVTAPAPYSGFVLTTVTNPLTTTLTVGNMEDLTLDFGYVAPTGVEVVSFTIQAAVMGVQMEWAVFLDADAAPTFTVWRALPGGRWKYLTTTPLSPLLISGSYAYYGYTDTNVYPGTTYLYRLESSTGEVFGPWEVRVPEVDDGGSTVSDRRTYLPMIAR